MSINKNKLLVKSIILVLFIVLNALIMLGIAHTISFFQTGAERRTIFNKNIEGTDISCPHFEWTIAPSCLNIPNDLVVNKLEKDYTSAICFKNLSTKANEPVGLKDFFVNELVKKISAYFPDNITHKLKVEATSLEHHPSILYYAEDINSIFIQDTAVIEYSRIFKADKCLNEGYTKSDYEIVFYYVTGNWKIRQYLKTKGEPYDFWKDIPKMTDDIVPNFSVKEGKIWKGEKEYNIQGINYYPQNSPWDKFWSVFDTLTIEKDMALIQKMGFNTVRFFIPYQQFGENTVHPEYIKRLVHFVHICEKYELNVIPTLFDFYSNYQVEDWTMCDRHLQQIVTPLKDAPNVLMWDIKNEPDLDYKNHPKIYVDTWLDFILHQTKKYSPHQLVTIGWLNPTESPTLSEKVDIVSFHYYDAPNDFTNIYTQLKQSTPNKPIVIQEYGSHSYNSCYYTESKTPTDQANYYKAIHKAFDENKMPHYLAWTMYDFPEIPNSVVGSLPWRKGIQENFGLIDANGQLKPAIRYVAPNYKNIEINSSTINYLYRTISIFSFLLIGLGIGWYKYNKKRAK